jgi:PPM family protein phosphatase
MKPLQVADESITGRRELNEDSVLTVTLSDERRLFAVADGMGGHAAGEVASAMALDVLQEAMENGLSLEASCQLANERVYAESESDVGKQGMGTTLVVILVDGDQYEIANIGDSRGYEITADGVRQITEDHSFVAEAVRRGHDEADAMQSRYKDALLRCIGTSAEVEVDIFGPFSADRDVAVLLCSDGLYKTLSADDMRELFAGLDDLEETTQALVSAAYDAGSDDNISVVLAEWGRVPRESELHSDPGTGDAPTLVLDEAFEPPEEERGGEPVEGAGGVEPAEAAEVDPPSPKWGWTAAVATIVVVLLGVVALIVL